MKKPLLESNEEKVELLRRIDVEMDKMVDPLEQLVDVNKSQSNSAHQKQFQLPYYSYPTAMFQTIASQASPQPFLKEHFPSNDL